MEGFTVHIQQRLAELLAQLIPSVDLQSTEAKLEALFEEIGFRNHETRERALQRLEAILEEYQQGLTETYEQTKAALFKLVAQLEYPSRQ